MYFSVIDVIENSIHIDVDGTQQHYLTFCLLCVSKISSNIESKCKIIVWCC